jgi:2-iminoacetate synthase ThiH
MNYCPFCGVSTKKTTSEVYTVSSDELVKKVKDLIHEGNIKIGRASCRERV